MKKFLEGLLCVCIMLALLAVPIGLQYLILIAIGYHPWITMSIIFVLVFIYEWRHTP